jgi:HEAT repeat protein
MDNRFVIICIMSIVLLNITAFGQNQTDVVISLIDNLKNSPSSNVRVGAAETLGEIADTRAVEPLAEALNDDDNEVRLFAALSLLKLGDRRALNGLILALNDSDSRFRFRAANALLDQKDDRIFEPMVYVLKNDPDPNVRGRAAMFLVRSKNDTAIDPLIQALNDSSWEVSVVAAKGLGDFKEPRTVKPLILVLRNKDMDLNFAAKDSLVKIGEPAVEPLIAALNSKNENVRLFAVWALEGIGDPRAVEPLIQAFNMSSDWSYRYDIQEALESINERINKYGPI